MVRIRLQQVGLILLGLALAAVMVSLGLWQMQVFENQGQDGAIARMNEPAVALTSVAGPGTQITDGYGRTVTFSGHYRTDRQVLLPVSGDVGGYRVLTPFELADGTYVPVLRGRIDGGGAPDPPTGTIDQAGVLLASEKPGDSGSTGSGSSEQGLDTVYLPVLVQQWDAPMIAGYVTLPADQAAAQGLTPDPPDLPSGRGSIQNLGYALQWWVFAACAIGFSLHLARHIGLAAERRRLIARGLLAEDDAGPSAAHMS